MRITITTLVVCLGLSGQAPMKQSFEVASVKAHKGFPCNVRMTLSGPRFTLSNVMFTGILMTAYDLRDSKRIAGGPSWMEDCFDIDAKAEGDGPLSQAQMKPMLRSLLEDRFKLKAHLEMKEMPVYALVIGKGGPKFKESALGTDPMMMLGGGKLIVKKTTMAKLAQYLENAGVDHPVIDRTGLTGEYDLEVAWVTGTPVPDSDGVSVFTAMQEQLGLKLEVQKGPVEMLVIDHVERPAEN